MLVLQNISYLHPNKDLLFEGINLTVNRNEKIALIGNNGVGKSTLLKISAGELQPTSGQLIVEAQPYYVPQIFGQFNHLTIVQALQIEDRWNAFVEILNGNTTDENFNVLNEDWTIETRYKEAFNYWKLHELDLSQKMETLSGGQKTKVFLAGILFHKPSLVLLDEPSNHLDMESRELLYDFIQTTKSTLMIVSHDRKLLNHLDKICELHRNGIKEYGGHFDFYKEQKQIAQDALNQDIHSKEKALRKAKEKERETMERQQKSDQRGKGKKAKEGVARIMMNTLRNHAENSSSKLKNVHTEKIGGISQDLQTLRSQQPDMDKMKFGFDHSALHKGKVLCTAKNINFAYQSKNLWNNDLNFQMTSGERIALKGINGSGKTTLIKLILGKMEPHTGIMTRTDTKSVYIDQDYSLLDDSLKVYEQAQQFNTAALQEHEIKIRLNRFLFTKSDWDKPCNTLSGGERMRLSLCCLMINSKSPDLIVFDEPTNNLDLQNVEILTAAINEYQGAIIVVSHDETFLEQINIQREIEL